MFTKDTLVAWRDNNQNPHEVNGNTVYDERVKVFAESEDGTQKWFNEGSVPEGFEELMRQDIANTPFDQLDDHWKADNRAAADVVVGLMVERDGTIDLGNPATRSEVGGIIHDAWISRNEWVNDPEYGDPILAKPFDALPEGEQAKDIAQVKTALEVFSSEQ